MDLVPNLLDTLTREYVKAKRGNVGMDITRPKLVNPITEFCSAKPVIEPMFNRNIVANDIVIPKNVPEFNSLSQPLKPKMTSIATTPPAQIASAIPIPEAPIKPIKPTISMNLNPTIKMTPILKNSITETILDQPIPTTNKIGNGVGTIIGGATATKSSILSKVGSVFSWISPPKKVLHDIFWVVGCILFIILILYLRSKFVANDEDDSVSDFYPNKI